MRKLSLIAFFLLSIAANAQTSKHIVASGTNFVQPVTDKKWGNRNGNDFTSATFKDYTGESFVSLRTDKEITVTFDFQAMTRTGDLKLVLSSGGNDTDFAELSTPFDRNFVSEGKVTVTLQADTEYRLRLIGNHAKGSFRCKWTESAPELTTNN